MNNTQWWHTLIPQSWNSLRQGYGVTALRADAFAGLTVAIVALPLAMALAIASGATPDKGLITVVVAGLLISLLGGSRVQIGGPTGAFVVVIFNVIAQHGYNGLIVATLMAGIMLVIAGLMRLGDWIKYIPQPVVTGFTAGIAVIIFSSQIRDLFGLDLATIPGGFTDKWAAFWQARGTADLNSFLVAAVTFVLIIGLRRFLPRVPAFLIAIGAAAAAVWGLSLPVATIGSAFGGIPQSLPAPQWPAGIDEALVIALLPSAFTIAFLAGVESLLSAMVADGMTGQRHKSNAELVGQGVANCASALFGGLPATGAIARTATNIRAGGRTPVAGILHAVFVLLFMVMFAPLASYIPLAALAAVLVIVAWNMSEIEKFRALLRGPLGDRFVLLVTFSLTILVDLTIAIEVGVVMGAILFMHRMAEVVEIQTHKSLFDNEDDQTTRAPDAPDMREDLPPGVEVFQIRGPLFFGVASRLLDVLEQVRPAPRIFILRLSLVPMIDSSGAAALEEFIRRCQAQGTTVILSSVQAPLQKILRVMHLQTPVIYTGSYREARAQAEQLIADQTT